MPTIAEFEGIKIRMYNREHPPPHFHALYGGQRAEIDIATLEVIVGSLPVPVLRRVREWAREHQTGLALNWIRCLDHEPPEKL